MTCAGQCRQPAECRLRGTCLASVRTSHGSLGTMDIKAATLGFAVVLLGLSFRPAVSDCEDQIPQLLPGLDVPVSLRCLLQWIGPIERSMPSFPSLSTAVTSAP